MHGYLLAPTRFESWPSWWQARALSTRTFFTESWLSKVDAHFEIWRLQQPSIWFSNMSLPDKLEFSSLLHPTQCVCSGWEILRLDQQSKNGHQNCCCCCTRPILYQFFDLMFTLKCVVDEALLCSRHASFLVLSVYNNTSQSDTDSCAGPLSAITWLSTAHLLTGDTKYHMCKRRARDCEALSHVPLKPTTITLKISTKQFCIPVSSLVTHNITHHESMIEQLLHLVKIIIS